MLKILKDDNMKKFPLLKRNKILNPTFESISRISHL